MPDISRKKTVLLTPNRRLAQYLLHKTNLAHSNFEIKTWETPNILPMNTWLAECWQQNLNPRILLTEQQEHFLWKTTITEISGDEFSEYAALAQDALRLIYAWQLDIATWQPAQLSEDIRLFLRWHKAILEKREAHGWILQAELPNLLSPKTMQLPSTIELFGFEELSPQLKVLFADLEKHNCKVIIHNQNWQQSSCSKIGFNDADAEFYAMARWAKQLQHNQPQANIGCIVHNLTELRPTIERVFNEVFSNNVAFNISAGKSLISYPIIDFALTLLALENPISLPTLSKILLSPFFADAAAEYSARSILDLELRQANKTHFSISDLINATKHVKNISFIINVLQKLPYKNDNSQASVSEWIEIFIAELQKLGFLEGYQLDRTEQQTLARFQKLLQEFTQLGLCLQQSGVLDRRQCLTALQSFVARTTFQPATEAVRINILGMLEAGGINFDYLWVMGMDHENWPQSAKPNPFIPLAIQRQHQLAHSSAERELQFCTNLTQRFSQSAHKVIFSYQKQREDRALSPSPLITNFKEITLDNLSLFPFVPTIESIRVDKNLETIKDEMAPALLATELTHGGSKILDLQSSCPFRAFANIRLHAEEIPLPDFGIGKKQRGALVHAILETFWQKVKTHAALCALSDEELTKQINMCIRKAFAQFAINKELGLLEKTFLQNLIWRFLEAEKQREPFIVLATEQTIPMQFDQLKFNLRVDRIDQLADQELLVLDYKTSKALPSLQTWFDVRPQNIQLPLYAVALDKVKNIAFAQINAEKVIFRKIDLECIRNLLQKLGKIDADTMLNWQTLISSWTQIFKRLAADFIAGYAKVDPIDQKVCANCNLQPLCRICANAK